MIVDCYLQVSLELTFKHYVMYVIVYIYIYFFAFRLDFPVRKLLGKPYARFPIQHSQLHQRKMI